MITSQWPAEVEGNRHESTTHQALKSGHVLNFSAYSSLVIRDDASSDLRPYSTTLIDVLCTV